MVGLEKPKLPDRVLQHVTYQYVGSGGPDLFDLFAQTLSNLKLAAYDLRPYEKNLQLFPDDELPLQSPGSMAGLVTAGLLKRFESSIYALTLSLNRLDALLRRFSEALEADPPRILDLANNLEARRLLEEEREDDEDNVDDLDLRWQAVIQGLPTLPEAERYDFGRIKLAVTSDREAMAVLRQALPEFTDDGKMLALRALFEPGGRLHRKRTLLFSQFRDTAVYVHRCLADRGWRDSAKVGPIALVHGGTPANDRAAMTAWFDPDRAQDIIRRRFAGEEEPQIMVSTDVLAEGHNLQLAEAAVNLDLHWNPQVAVQRSGRVDRLNSPHDRVYLLSFLPEEGLEAHLGLIRALERRFRLIHLLGLGDEPVTKVRGDLQELTFEQMRRLYSDDVSVLDEIERTWTLGSTDFMRAPLEAFLSRHAREKLKEIPLGVQSVKLLPKGWTHGNGAFVAFNYQQESIWRFYPLINDVWGEALLDEAEIFKAIACSEREPRHEWPSPFDGPGGMVDWELLARAAREVADELTRRRTTAALQRGASERSRRLRLQILEIANLVGEVPDLGDLLDRLEEVRVEDFDHRHEMRPFQDRLREARRAVSAGNRHDHLIDAVARGIALFGRPQGDTDTLDTVVMLDHLQLVAWENLVLREPPVAAEGQLQLV